MKSQHIEHASIETVGYYNPDAGEYVTICIPESRSPKTMFRVPLTDIPPDLREVVKSDGIRLRATVDVEEADIEHEEIHLFSDFELALDS